MNYIIVSHYTDKYKPYADNLKRSCEDRNIPCVIAYVLKQETWVKDIQLKAKSILNAMEIFNYDVVWIDADGEFNQYPHEFDKLAASNEYDLGLHYFKTTYNPNELVSSCMYFKNTEKVRQLVRDWIELNETNYEWDQRNLQKLIEDRNDLRIYHLPPEYMNIDGLDTFRTEKMTKEPVITQYQASRIHADKR